LGPEERGEEALTGDEAACVRGVMAAMLTEEELALVAAV
jgi:hypothetical protein